MSFELTLFVKVKDYVDAIAGIVNLGDIILSRDLADVAVFRFGLQTTKKHVLKFPRATTIPIVMKIYCTTWI